MYFQFVDDVMFAHDHDLPGIGGESKASAQSDSPGGSTGLQVIISTID